MFVTPAKKKHAILPWPMGPVTFAPSIFAAKNFATENSAPRIFAWN